MTLAGLVFSWVGYQINWIRQRREIIANPKYGYGTGPFFLWERPDAPWQLRILGEPGYLVISVPMVGDVQERFGNQEAISIDDLRLYPEEWREMERVSQLFPEANVYCNPP